VTIENGDPDHVAVRLLWIDLDEVVIQHANQFVGQANGEEIYLSLGCAPPPVIMGDTPDERRAQAQNIGYIPVRPIARVSMTRDHLDQLIRVLNQTVEIYERQKREREGGEG
jgi:hypothetical protein